LREITTSTSFKDLINAENIRQVTEEFTSSPKEGRRADEFFAFKSPTASAGYEHANIGTEGQPATPRTPKSQTIP
jgi:hypothetical protein